VDDTHETLARPSSLEPEFGLDTTDHELPLKVAAKVREGASVPLS
jgi:hypothetical protein